MEPGVKRQYRSVRRAERAAATRATIRGAAASLFVERGFAATTMREVAAHAGVGERTLYDAFPTKVELFHHVVGIAIVGDEEPVAAADRPEFQALLEETSPRRAVSRYADYVAALFDRAGALIMVAAESSGAEPAMRAFGAEGAEATRRNIATFVASLAEHHVLRQDPAATEDAVYALSSPHVHHLLRSDCGWTSQQYRAWLEQALAESLLGPEHPRT